MRVDCGLSMTDLNTIPAEARQAEALGYDAVSTGEITGDPLFRLLLAAEHTQLVHLETSVLIAFPRSPMVVAYQAWELQGYSKGRLHLGIGTQVRAHIQRRFSTTWDSPGPRLREYIMSMRAIWECWQKGTKLDFQGKFYRFNLMTPFFTPKSIEHPHIPIYISALNPYNLQLAGELCDGIRMHGFNTPKYTQKVILPYLEAGAKKAGRTLKDLDIVGVGFTITGANEEAIEKQIRPTKKHLAFYASTPAYRPVMDIHGWGEEHLELHRLSREGKWDEMADVFTDEMLAEFANIGTHDQIAKKIKQRWGGVSTRCGFKIPVNGPKDAETLKSILAELRKA
ncbi:MAG: TIGR03617 family F420-dependent LLM class oxidoreductase [Chloroflexi bacterium]|nr:TIGR03617 family F420-dependent LLM class oxidoreductase [Chloroflexota bacterium]